MVDSIDKCKIIAMVDDNKCVTNLYITGVKGEGAKRKMLGVPKDYDIMDINEAIEIAINGGITVIIIGDTLDTNEMLKMQRLASKYRYKRELILFADATDTDMICTYDNIGDKIRHNGYIADDLANSTNTLILTYAIHGIIESGVWTENSLSSIQYLESRMDYTVSMSDGRIGNYIINYDLIDYPTEVDYTKEHNGGIHSLAITDKIRMIEELWDNGAYIISLRDKNITVALISKESKQSVYDTIKKYTGVYIEESEIKYGRYR